MTYIIGRRMSVGVAKETVRGSTSVAVYWLPKTAVSIDDKINVVVDEASVGTIHDADTQEICNNYAEGSIEGNLSETTMGILALATLGTEASQAAHSGETIVYDHVFSVAETATHQSLSVSVAGANEGNGVIYPHAMIDTFELNMEVGKYCTYKASFRSDVSAANTVTATFGTTDHLFRPQDGVVKFATAQSGLTGATAITLKKATLSINKNIEEDWTVGALSAAERLNKQFVCEGTLELVYADRTYIDTILQGDLVKAVRFSMVNTSVTIGSTSNPAIIVDLYRAKLSEVARKIDNNGIITQTIKYKAFYSLADAKMLALTVVSQRSAAY